jgi:hypothetical protein
VRFLAAGPEAISPLKKGTFFFSGAVFPGFLQPEKMDVPLFNGLLASVTRKGDPRFVARHLFP